MDSDWHVNRLIQIFIHQLTEGCGDAHCPASTCYSHRLAAVDRPLRRYTGLSARAAAFHLALLDSPWSQMCPVVVARLRSRKPEHPFPGQLPDVAHEKGVSDSPQSKKDMKCYSQNLFDTDTIKEFLNQQLLAKPTSNKGWRDAGSMLDVAEGYVYSDPEWAPLGAVAILDCINGFAKLMPALQFNTHLEIMELKYDEAFEDPTLFAIAHRLIKIVSELNVDKSHVCKTTSCSSKHVIPETRKSIRKMLAAQFKRSDELFFGSSKTVNSQQWMVLRRGENAMQVPMTDIFILIQCAIRVFYKAWDGDSNVGFHSISGQAVRVLSILRKIDATQFNVSYTDYRADSILGRIWPRSPVSKFFDDTFQGRSLKAMEYAAQYSQKGPNTISLLDHPWLFPHQIQVENFRALCFRRMERAVEEAHLNLRLLVSGMAWHSPDPPEVRQLVSGPLRTATARCFALEVHREDLLDDLLNQIWRRERRELLRPLRVQIINEGEEGLDQGGVAQELFQAGLTKILAPAYGIFNVDPLTKMAWFQPVATEPLHKYELIGVLFALAIHNGFVLPVTFPLVFYHKLVSSKPPVLSPQRIEDGWPKLAESLEGLLDWSDGDVEDVFVRQYAFSFEAFGEVIHVDMTKPYSDWSLDAARAESATNSLEAPLVTNENRINFVEDYITWLTDRSIRAQFSAFARGFHSLIPRTLLTTVTPSALQILVEGHQEIDMQDLESATSYEGGFTSSSTTIRNFWAVARTYDDEHKRNLLEFITASDRLPVSGARGVRLLIQKNGGDSERLPTAMTCFATLLLPEYKERDKLRAKLEIVLGEARGFGLR